MDTNDYINAFEKQFFVQSLPNMNVISMPE